MASVRPRGQMAVGSTPWIKDENEQVAQFCAQEAEDFAFSARNEVEWLNEHMADIFGRNSVNVTEIFKTPGKLRGKTPRTARKRNPLEVREPLTDIFSTNAQPNGSPSRGVSPQKTLFAPEFQVAEDPIAPGATHKTNTDSGYHGLPEDEPDIELLPTVPQSSAETNDTMEIFPKSPLQEQLAMANQPEDQTTAERSFHSAKEDITKGEIISVDTQDGVPTAADVEALAEPSKGPAPESLVPATKDVPKEAIELDVIDKDLDEDLVVDESRSPSQGSSPARTLVRKSSLTFAALPPREPLTTKKSIGGRVSRTSHLDQSKANLNRGSFLGRFAGGKSIGGSTQHESTHEMDHDDGMDIDMDRAVLAREDSDGDAKMTQLHNKSSTQRLHDRINMLGKSQPARPTKSIPAAAPSANLNYPELPNLEPQAQIHHTSGLRSKRSTLQASNLEDDDDWIQPPQMQLDASTRPQLPKSISVDVMEDIRGRVNISDQEFGRGDQHATKELPPLRQTNAQNLQNSGSRPSMVASASQSTSPTKPGLSNGVMPLQDVAASAVDMANAQNLSTTPTSNPLSKRYVDGPLSASKSKLQSIMKTARGLFSSSAGVSAQARMETLSPASIRARGDIQGSSIEDVLESKPMKNNALLSPLGGAVGRKTRSSTERDERRKEVEAKERQQAELEYERYHEQENQKTAPPPQIQAKAPAIEPIQLQTKPTRQSPRKMQNQEASRAQPDVVEGDLLPQSMAPPAPQPPAQPSQAQRPKDAKRPIKPAKEHASKPKPQPVAIRVGTLSQRIPLTNATLSSSLQDSLPPSQPKQQAVAKKGSTASLQTCASNSSLKSSVTSVASKPKALLAAERKKEQDEREAQRKLDQKREIERKRATQQEEARRQEQLQRQEAERQRERERVAAAEDPKKIAQRQQIEKRRMEMNKKDQQRMPQRPPVDPAPIPHPPPASTTRQELGGARPPSRLHAVPDHGRLLNNQPTQNPAKPLMKRVFDQDIDDEAGRPARPQGGPSYQQNEGKRRRTEDEELQEVRVRPTMAPPIRQSGIRKDGPKSSIFGSSYTTAPPPAPHHHNPPSLLKSTTANQAYQQHAHQNQIARPGHHPDMAKFTNGKIPFAEAPNPPPPTHKTPLPSKLAHPPAKPSPQYPNGENIHLADIETSDEDESDDESGSKPKPSNLPEWAQSPQLRQLLMTQDEQMDADAVFGPVASPHMEEMFRERHHRFRSRTSSANWNGADRLTDEEIRRDVEARQRLRREGGWTFGL